MELTPIKIVRQWAQTINWNARPTTDPVGCKV